MTILITGGCGFIGSSLAIYFNELGHKVTVFDNLVRRGSEFNLEDFKKMGIEFIHGDVRCKEDFVPLAKKKYDAICECSAQPSAIDGYANPYFDISNNTLGLINTLEFARKNDSIVVFWSTNKVYSGEKINCLPMQEDETRYSWKNVASDVVGWDSQYGISEKLNIDGGQHSIYGLSKVMSDLACQEYSHAFDVKTVINRFSCLAGPRQWGKPSQGWAAWWAIAAYFDIPLTYFGWKGKQVRDVLFAEDICRLIESEINNIDLVKGEAFNIGGGPKYTMSLIEATMLMEKMYNKKLKFSVLEDSRKSDQCIYISDIRKIKDRIGWEPQITIEKGYETIIRWVHTNKTILEKLYA
jgi:CDP-paratose 2-epimerase